MEKRESIYELLNNYLEIDDESINVLNRQIDSDTQLEYFECSKNQDENISEEEIINEKELIFDSNISISRKKDILVRLASISHVEAYRTIERFVQKPINKLSEWAYLALQESRLLLESKLLDENKVLISTGLGGRDDKLRYFIVFFTSNGRNFTKIQQRILASEINYAYQNTGAEIEDIVFDDEFASLLTLIPLKVQIQDLFKKVIRECNEFDNFLFNDYIITNVKILSVEEIKEILAVNNLI